MKNKQLKVLKLTIVGLMTVASFCITVIGVIYFFDPTHPLASAVIEVVGTLLVVLCTGWTSLFFLYIAVRVFGISAIKALLEKIFK